MSLLLAVGIAILGTGQSTEPDAPGPNYKNITDPKEIQAFEDRAKSLQESQTMAQYAAPYIAEVNRARRGQPPYKDGEVAVGSNTNGNVFWLQYGVLTPLADGHEIKAVYHRLPGGAPDETRYYRAFPEGIRAKKKINIVLYPEKPLKSFRSVSVTILLNDPKVKFKIEDKGVMGR